MYFLDKCRTCFGHVWDMFGTYVGHVFDMFGTCVGYVLDMFWICFGICFEQVYCKKWDKFWAIFKTYSGFFVCQSVASLILPTGLTGVSR